MVIGRPTPHHPELFFERGRRQNIDTALKIADVDVVWAHTVLFY